MQNSTYNIASPGTANDNKTVTYKQPAWTQYKVGRAITDSTPYANTALKIDQVGTRTREGDQWVHVYDPSNVNSPVTGWILYSGLKQVAAPVADNAIQINLVDPSNNTKVVKTITITRNGAQKGTNFGTNSNGTWSISNSDRASILNQIQGALSGTTYGLDNLSTAQMAQIGQATFGSSINLPVNTVTNIADNALRINFVKSDGTSLKTMDWAKSGAVKGNAAGSSVLGSSLWTLASGDLTDVQNQITTALNGTGYQLQASGNTLTANQQDVIARGTFGTQVYISVVPTNNETSTIVPNVTINGVSNVLKAFNSDATNNGYDTNVVLTNVPTTATDASTVTNLSANDILAISKNSDKLTKFQTWFKTQYGDSTKVAAVNALFANSALSQYIFDKAQDWDYGPGTNGTSFPATAIANQITGNAAMKSMKSPIYPKFDTNGNISWHQGNYVFNFANSGNYGSNVNVYYNYTDTPLTTN